MQSLDAILTDITLRTEQLIRKLKELGIENEYLQKENRQLKQDILAKSKVDLFNKPDKEDIVVSSKTQEEVLNIKQELNLCIEEVKACLNLVDDQ